MTPSYVNFIFHVKQVWGPCQHGSLFGDWDPGPTEALLAKMTIEDESVLCPDPSGPFELFLFGGLGAEDRRPASRGFYFRQLQLGLLFKALLLDHLS